MPLGTGNVTQSAVNSAGFIPEVWSDEIIAAYKKNLVAANLIKKMNMKGKKGDVVHFPAPARASAAVKAANTQVTVNAESGTEKTVTINKHYEYSRLIEDFAEVQVCRHFVGSTLMMLVIRWLLRLILMLFVLVVCRKAVLGTVLMLPLLMLMVSSVVMALLRLILRLAPTLETRLL